MYHSNRRSLILAIVMGALTLLLLSACGTPDTGTARAAVPTALGATVAPSTTDAGTPDPAATAAPSDESTATPAPDDCQVNATADTEV